VDKYLKGIAENTQFHSYGLNNQYHIYQPFYNAHRIKVGSNVIFAPFSFITVTDLCIKTSNKEVNAYIEDNVRIGPFNRIEVFNFIWIQKSVLFGPNVFVSDATHNYQDIKKPVKKQGMEVGGGVIIEEGAWIGANSVISGSLRIGKGAVVGANTVLNHTNVPAHSVVSGTPPTLVKIYDYDNEEWVMVNKISSDRLNEILAQRES
jgi:acetyltransferase-like isoleucine patch superfamily enzyme